MPNRQERTERLPWSVEQALLQPADYVVWRPFDK